MSDLISRQAAIDAFEDTTFTKNEIRRRLLELPSVQPEQRWIPTSKKLPEYDKPVLLSTAWGKTEIGFWTQRGWMIVVRSYRELEKGAVDAWMPLPEPYEEDKQND